MKIGQVLSACILLLAHLDNVAVFTEVSWRKGDAVVELWNSRVSSHASKHACIQ